MIDPQAIPIVDFTETSTIRLISTAYITEPALTPLADNENQLRILEDIEMLTSARQDALIAVPSGVNPDELLSEHHGFGWTYVNAAFCYTRLTGNRFNGPERGAWYATFGRNATKSAQAEVAYHLTRELDHVGIYENVTAYRELLVGFVTRFHDLTSYTGHAFLDPDPEIAYPAGQALARTILQGGGNSLLYPSARNPKGKCLAAFRPHIIQNIRYGKTWTFDWRGQREPVILEH